MKGSYKNKSGVVSSDDYGTPKWLYDILNEDFAFDFDPCPRNYTVNGLDIPWVKSNFVNPPYNRVDKPLFIEKAFAEYKKGNKVCLLIPAYTGTKQYHRLIAKACQLRLTWSEWFENRKKYRNKNLVIFVEGRIAFSIIDDNGQEITKEAGKHDSMLVFLREKKSWF